MTTATLAGLVFDRRICAPAADAGADFLCDAACDAGQRAGQGTNFSVLVRQMVDGANNFSLLSIPFSS